MIPATETVACPKAANSRVTTFLFQCQSSPQLTAPTLKCLSLKLIFEYLFLNHPALPLVQLFSLLAVLIIHFYLFVSRIVSTPSRLHCRQNPNLIRWFHSAAIRFLLFLILDLVIALILFEFQDWECWYVFLLLFEGTLANLLTYIPSELKFQYFAFLIHDYLIKLSRMKVLSLYNPYWFHLEPIVSHY